MESVGKRHKKTHIEPLSQIVNVEEAKEQTVIIQFRDAEDQNVGVEISVPTDTSKADLNKMLSEVRDPVDGEEEHQRF